MNAHRLDQAITILGLPVRQDDEGRYSLTDLQRCAVASGSAPRKTNPSDFLRSNAAKGLVEALAERDLITGIPVIKPLMFSPGRYGGTFAVRQIVYAYAAWISPKFTLFVFETFDQAINGELRHLTQTERHFFEARPHWKQIREMAMTGQKYSIIARLIGRSAGSVSRCVARMERVGLINPIAHRMVRFKPATAQKLITTNQLCLEWGTAA